ncbi:kinase-like domain-containing protein [Gigaspora rosea]|uniref:Kinase-like domain-containing protein n=1 Tax=Gigaspora rosea TaxID=44941 RepID=A0A397W0W6_9GLOM|nr:kinase-like domain-containing protein [Gigaspora rosea]
MEISSDEWLEKAISDGHINYLEYNKFTDPTNIGSGGFGTVYKYEWKDCELAVALKCLKVDTNLDQNIIRDFIRELKLLRKVDYHPNIIKFYGVTKDNNGNYNMVLQYAIEGNLREYLNANFIKLLWSDKLRIAKEILLGLLFLHENNIIHRDLHSKNILIHQGQPKIADFGLSKQINEMSIASNSVIHGMLEYVEPQCLIKQGYKRDKKSDIYSFGVILWEISSGKPPFQSFEQKIALCFHICQGNREEPIEGTPPQYIELYKQCWDKEPSNRPGINTSS